MDESLNASSHSDADSSLNMTDPLNKSVNIDNTGHGDDSALEDRYNKLKLIAVKLKKKVVEQNDEIERLRDENVKVVGKSQNVSTIQQEFDKAQDEIERLRKLQVVLEKDLKASVEENIKVKEANFECQSQIQSLTTSHKFLRDKCEKLDTSEEEMTKWKTRVEELESGLKDAKQTEISAIQEKRQTAMLSLEITDYEKKLQDMSERLDEARRQNDNLVLRITEADNKIISLEDTINKLESTVVDLNKTKIQLESDVGRKSEKIIFLQDEVSKSNDKLLESKAELSKINKEYENARFNFSSETRTLIEKCTALEKIIGFHESKASIFEENKRSRESYISNLKLELNQLETEYSNYKLKAQAMLKSQKPSSSNSKDLDELENLNKIVQDFHSEISILKTDCQTLKLENENLIMERAELGVLLNNVKTDAIQKEVGLGNEIHKFRQDLRQKDLEMKNAIEASKTEKEAIITAYKGQLDAVKQSYDLRLKGLEEEITNLKYSRETTNHFDRMAGFETDNIGTFDTSEGNQHNHRSDVGQRFALGDIDISALNITSAPNAITQPLTIDTTSLGINFDHFRMLPRGECEGSESVTSSRSHLIQANNNYNLTFEQLLSSDTSKSIDGNGLTPVFGPSLKEELIRCQNQIKHLTVLLRESESNSDRLAQLSEALKEEIRRVERDNERKKHLKENTEYLKNVLLKFVTLHGEDEKLRLVPVLKTMLSLAPAEVSELETSVKGMHNHQHSQDGNKSGRNPAAWYLPTWN